MRSMRSCRGRKIVRRERCIIINDRYQPRGDNDIGFGVKFDEWSPGAAALSFENIKYTDRQTK